MSVFLENVMAYLVVITVALPRLCYLYWRCLKMEYRLKLLKARVQRVNRNTNGEDVYTIEEFIVKSTNEVGIIKEDQKNFLRKILFLDNNPQGKTQFEAQSGDQSIARMEPPKVAEIMVALFAKKRYRKAILSDLAEDFDSDLAAGMPLDRAERRYWAAALNSIGPQLLAAVKRLGIWGLIVEVARRING